MCKYSIDILILVPSHCCNLCFYQCFYLFVSISITAVRDAKEIIPSMYDEDKDILIQIDMSLEII